MKLLHTRTKIFFPNPYVVRIEYGNNIPMDRNEADYRKIIRNTYKLTHGTWGYSGLGYEQTNDYNTLSIIQANFNGLNQQNIINPLFGIERINSLRGYLCFTDELDALQFRLSVGTNTTQVKMWPARCFFTIHELVETDEP